MIRVIPGGAAARGGPPLDSGSGNDSRPQVPHALDAATSAVFEQVLAKDLCPRSTLGRSVAETRAESRKSDPLPVMPALCRHPPARKSSSLGDAISDILRTVHRL